jgi:hypothetical protein
VHAAAAAVGLGRADGENAAVAREGKGGAEAGVEHVRREIVGVERRRDERASEVVELDHETSG